MKTKTLASLLAAVSMLMIVALPWMPSASADEMEGVKTVDAGHGWGQSVAFFSGDYFTLSFTIDVQNDVYIDVLLLNEENYNKYRNGQSFSYYTEGTDFNTLYKKVSSITFYTHDNYYLAVDNTDEPPNGAEPVGYCTFHYTISGNIHTNPSNGGSSVTYDDDEDSGLLGILCAIVIIGIVVIVIVVIGVLLQKKQKAQQSPQQQPYYPPPQQEQPPQPYYQDQQPPPPPDYRPPQ